MLIDFDKLKEIAIPHMNGGNGEVIANMYNDQMNRIITSRLPKGSSIGTHPHPNGCDISYVVSGHGRAFVDGVEEELHPGVCHYCPKGHSHSIENTSNEDLVLFTVSTQQ